MPFPTMTDRETLEHMMDRSSLATVLETLAEIASEKAEHIRTNWQDSATAAHWDIGARAVNKAAARINV